MMVGKDRSVLRKAVKVMDDGFQAQDLPSGVWQGSVFAILTPNILS